jgi:glycosyltransferase involved in cell wall biosynthesis
VKGPIRIAKLGSALGRVAERVLFRKSSRYLEDVTIDAKTQRFSMLGQIEIKPALMYPDSGASVLASIIIPCFNYGQFVSDALASALGQTLQALEVIIVDDGSTDPATHHVLQALARPPRVQLVSQPNRGLPAARNTGIALARGEYICCLDADDTLEPTYLELCIAALEADRSVGFAYSWARLFGDETYIWRTRDFNIEQAMHDNHTPVSAVFRRDDWLAVGGYRPDMRDGYEDWEFWLRIAALGRRGRVIRAPLFNHRKHGRSMTDDAHSKRSRLMKSMRALNPSIFASRRLRRLVSKIVPAAGEGAPLAVLQRQGVLGVPDPRPHLLVVIPWLADGGAEMLLLDVLTHLRAQWRMSIVTSLPDEQTLWSAFREITQEIFPLAGAFTEERQLAVVEHLIATRRTRVMLSSGSNFAYNALAELKRRHPDLATIDILHNDLTHGHIQSALKASQFIDRHVAVSERIASTLKHFGVSPSRVTTIPNGVDLETLFNPNTVDRQEVRHRLGLPKQTFVIAWIGRLAKEKRPEEFLHVVASLAPDVEVRALIVGDGPLARRLDRATRRLGLEPIIARLAHRNRKEIAEIYAAADALVLTSSVEGLPFVALEGLAMGCPVLSTRVGDLDSVIRQGENGWLVPVETPQALVAPLLALARNPDRANMRLRTRLSLDRARHSLTAMVDAYEQLFANVTPLKNALSG